MKLYCLSVSLPPSLSLGVISVFSMELTFFQGTSSLKMLKNDVGRFKSQGPCHNKFKGGSS